jgi:uncharacterized membrane protein YeaQ/YmgE (transglycosylase-associated protein family)
MLILALILIGMLVGWIANMILGGSSRPDNWGELLIAGIAGSFVGGLLLSLVFGDGLSIRPSGLIGSVLGAVIILFVVRKVRARR